MFTQLYLNDSFMIRKIIVAAVPAALVAVGMSLAISEPVNACVGGGCWRQQTNVGQPQLNLGGGGANTNQVYPNNQRRTPLLNHMPTFSGDGGPIGLTGHGGRG